MENQIYKVTKGVMGQNLSAKLGKMRKEKNWCIYPISDITKIIIQCDTRIAQIDAIAKTIRLSANRPNGAEILHLCMEFQVIPAPQNLIDALLESDAKETTVFIGSGEYH